MISNLAILLGAELDAELERQRAIAAGMRPATEPYMRLRDGRAVEADRDPGLAEWDRRSRNFPPTINGGMGLDEARPIGDPTRRSQAGRMAAAGAGGMLLGAAAALWVGRRLDRRVTRRAARR